MGLFTFSRKDMQKGEFSPSGFGGSSKNNTVLGSYHRSKRRKKAKAARRQRKMNQRISKHKTR